MSKVKITENTTWRQFMENPFLHASDIPKKGINVTIESYGGVEAYSKEAGQKETLKVMYVKEFKKPIAMSNRKAKQMAAIFGDVLMDSIGKTVHLFFINEKFFGKFQDVLHFKKEIVLVKEVFNSKSLGWDKCCESFKAGNSTIQIMEKHYKLDEDTKKKLTDLLPKTTEAKKEIQK